MSMNYRIYVGNNCPSCKRLKHLLGNRTDIDWLNVSDPTVLSDAMLDDVLVLPTLIKSGKKFTSINEILEEVNKW